MLRKLNYENVTVNLQEQKRKGLDAMSIGELLPLQQSWVEQVG